MLRVYKMPNGRRYRFDDSAVPEGAVLVGENPKAPAKKAAQKKPNKSKAPANKAKKAEKK